MRLMPGIKIETAEHKAVGPNADMYGHGPVTAVMSWTKASDAIGKHGEIEPELFICLDCGYTVADNRLLAHVECDRTENPIPKTWRELLDQQGGPSLPEPADDESWPIEE